jgi:hypothetical protein
MNQEQVAHMAPMRSTGLVLTDVIFRLIKYLIEGLAVALAAYLITMKSKKMSASELALLGLTAGAVFAILDLFAPSVAVGTRQGAGFGLGAGLVGFGGVNLPGVPPV